MGDFYPVGRGRVVRVSSGVRELDNQEKRSWPVFREAVLVAALYTLATALLGVQLVRLWQPDYALAWTVLSAGALAAVLWLLFRALPDNYQPSTQVFYPSLGPANHASLLRGVLLAWLAGFLLLPRSVGWPGWAPAALYTTAIILDGLDGLLARLTRHVSKLGQRLDIGLDGMGVLVASALGIAWGQLPPWYVLVPLAYYAFISGQWLRRKLGLALHPLPPSSTRRAMAGIQMGFLSAILWPVLPPALTTVAATVVMIPFLAGFLRDWLVVSGPLDAGFPPAERLTAAVERWLPVPVRLAVLLVFLLNLLQTGRLALFEGQSMPGVAWVTLLGTLVIAGVLGRTAGTLLAISVSLAAARWGIAPPGLMLIICGLVLLLLGSGNLSVWQPEEALLRMRHGGES